MLANISAQKLDHALLEYSLENGLLYSRYADDLTFSSNTYIGAEVAEKIAEIIQASGFAENREKRRFKGPGGRKTVTGLVVNDYVQLPREWRKNFRSLVHRVITDPAKHSHLADELCGGVGVLRAVYRVETHPLIVAGYRALALPREQKSSQDWQGP